MIDKTNIKQHNKRYKLTDDLQKNKRHLAMPFESGYASTIARVPLSALLYAASMSWVRDSASSMV